MVDLDQNATTPLLPAAADAMRFAPPGNPASGHAVGRRARQALDDAREKIAAHLGADPDGLIFTSGATESNNLAVFGLAGDGPGRILASAVEHPCVAEPLARLAARGFAVEMLPVDRRGIVQLAFAPGPVRFATLMLASHETGAIQPVAALAQTRLPDTPYPIPVHCDAAQAVGKIPVNMKRLGVATLAASAHKFRGPVGLGLLAVAPGVTIAPRAFGGHQQRGRRPGTEPVALAVGTAVALDYAVKHMDETAARLTALRARLWARLNAAGGVLNGPAPGDADSLPTTLNVSYPGCRADLLVMALDLAGVACSAGAACASGSVLPSPGLAATGVSDAVLRSAVRFSLGEPTTAADVEFAAEQILACVRRFRPAVPA